MADESDAGRRPALRRWTVTTIVLAAAAVHIYAHGLAGFTLPVPWPDELHFTLPAHALAERGSLWTPELHPTRPLMWMPPGYAVLLAPVVAVAGPSLIVARAASLVAVLVAAGALWRFVAAVAPAWLACIATAGFLLHPAVIVAGNVARMDAALLAVVLLGLALLVRRRPYEGLAVLATSVLIHPNGLFFAAAGAVAMGLGVRAGRFAGRPSRAGVVAIAISGCLWLVYVVWAATHWDGLVEDMAFQLARKAQRELWPSLLGRRTAMLAVVVAAVFIADGERRVATAWLLVLALPAWAVQRLGHEMWYHVFDALLAAAFAAAAGLAVLGVATRWPRFRPIVLVLGLGATAAMLSRDHPRLPHTLAWKRMRVASTPYVLDAEVSAVVRAVGDNARVRFLPRGDAVLFVARGVRVVDPVRYPMVHDVLVVHESPHHPPHWRRRARKALDAAASPRVVYERSDAERWWLVAQ